MPDDDRGLEPPEWVNSSGNSGSGRRPAPAGARKPPQSSRSGRPAGSRRPGAAAVRTPRDEPSVRPRVGTRPAPGPETGHDLDDEATDDHWEHVAGGGQGPRHVDSGSSRRARLARRQADRQDLKRHRRRTIAALGIVLVPILVVAIAVGWFVYELNPPGSPGKAITFQIDNGWGRGKIGDALQHHGVIGSSLAFQVYTKLTGAGSFRPGSYRFHEHLGVRDAVKVLKRGPRAPPHLTLILPPGLTISQIADRVGALPDHSRDRFLAAAQSGQVRSRYQAPGVASLEGLVSTDTYFIGQHESELDILRRLVATFDQRADALGLGNANPAGLTPYQTVVAASLIEREAGVDEDRPLISAVIHNRLARGMPLQIDATLCYAKGGCAAPPTNADKQIDSPYNTYKVMGLPPTPISAVSLKSLQAAQGPANVPYLYYVLIDKSGKSAFATTEQEHEKNVEEAKKKGLL